MKFKAVTLMEALVVSVIIAIITIPSIDMMSKMAISENTFNNDITSKEYKTALYEKISSSLMPATYIYPANRYITIPTEDSTAYVSTNTQALVILTPEFNTDGTLNKPSTGVTKFAGTAFSIIPESTWNGGSSSNYVLIETDLDDSSLNLSTDLNDPLKINTYPPTNWSAGDSYVLASNLKPAIFSTMNNNVFSSNTGRNIVDFAFISKADGIYFPSTNGSTMDDSSYISSITLRNWRQTTY